MNKKVKKIVLNYSTASQFYSCRRKFAWGTLLKLSPVPGPDYDGLPRDDTGKAFFKGKLLHGALEEHYKGKDPFEFIESYVPPMTLMRSLEDKRAGSMAHMKGIIEKYLEYYGNPDREYEIIQNEQKLELPINDWLSVTGTLDALVKNVKTGEISVMDHKTSSNFNQFTIPTIHVSDQFTLYIAMARAAGFHVTSAVVNAVSTSKKYLDSFEKDPEGLFLRIPTERSEAQIEEGLASLERIGEEIKWAVENQVFPKTPKLAVCHEFNAACPFLEVCSSETSTREAQLKQNFEVKELENASFQIEYEK